MDLLIKPARLQGTLTPPPSKSEAQRLVIAAALAGGRSTLQNIALSGDLRAALRCAETLGARWRELSPGTVEIKGAGGKPSHREMRRFDCGESAATLRFFLPLALTLCGGGVFTGRGRLLQRPLEPYFRIFEQQGIDFRLTDAELRVCGRLHPGDYRLPGDVSSQFFSGLLFALPLLDASSRLVAETPLQSADYVAMTCAALERAGVRVQQTGDAFSVSPQQYRAVSARAEADWSQAAFWIAAERLGGALQIEGLNEASLQGDRRMRAYAARMAEPGDVVLDLAQNPDLLPPLAALAALREGRCRLRGAARLRLKESDRLRTVAAALRALGARVEEYPDALAFEGLPALRGGAAVDCAGDHRVAMMCAVAAMRCEREIVLRGADCVDKSYPDFWERYQSLGGDCHVIDLG